jgi:hypothetical protein
MVGLHENEAPPAQLTYFIMNQRFNIDYLGNVLMADKGRAIVNPPRANQKIITQTKTFSQMGSLVRWVPEIVGGIFAVVYLVAALALGGGLLFFTFFH